MSKIKLIVEIEKRTYELIKDKPDSIAESIIANGTPLPNEQIAWEQGYEAGLAQGKQGRPQGEWRDNLIEVFRQSAEVGGDTFHLFEIERIINGEPI